MGYRVHAMLMGICLALCPLTARAQDIAASFADLPGVVKAGTAVYVTDTAGARTFGKIISVSVSSLTLAVMEVVSDKPPTVFSTGRERVFQESVVATISRSDDSGHEGAPIYPASWEKVDRLPKQADLTIVLKNGDKRMYRFVGVTPGALRVVGRSGNEEIVAKDNIRRIVRRGFHDSTMDGFVKGAAIIGGTSTLLVVAMVANCGFSCSGSGSFGTVVAGFGMMAAIGGAAGWAIDKAHKGTDLVFPVPATRNLRIDVGPVIAPRERGVRVSLRF